MIDFTKDDIRTTIRTAEVSDLPGICDDIRRFLLEKSPRVLVFLLEALLIPQM